MRFYIDSKAYNMREEKAGSFLLMVNATNQSMMLNGSTMKLFRETDAWVDLDAFVDSLGFKAVYHQSLWNDYATALYRLHVHGVSRLEDWPVSTESGTRMGRTADYHDLSIFCRKHKDAPFSVAEKLDDGYYGFYNIYDMLLRSDAAIVFARQEGNIVACMLMQLSKRSFGGLVMNVETVMFRGDLTEDQCKESLSDMLLVAQKHFRGKAVKMRYEAIHARQERLAGWLLENGFYRSAVLPEELSSGQTLVLYDFIL